MFCSFIFPNCHTCRNIYIYINIVPEDLQQQECCEKSVVLFFFLLISFIYTSIRISFDFLIYIYIKIAELDCCQIIILSIYVPSTHAYKHVLCISLDFPYETR